MKLLNYYIEFEIYFVQNFRILSKNFNKYNRLNVYSFYGRYLSDISSRLGTEK